MLVEISEPNGWARTLEIQPETPFTGTALTTSAVINLADVQALVASFEQQTGLERRDYTLAIIPEVHVIGTLAGQQLSDRFAPRLEFRYDKVQLWVPRSDLTDPLRPVESKMVQQPAIQPRSLHLLGLSLPASAARWISVIAFAFALGAIALILLNQWVGARPAQPAVYAEMPPLPDSALVLSPAELTRPALPRVPGADAEPPRREMRTPEYPAASPLERLIPATHVLRIVVPALMVMAVVAMVGATVFLVALTNSATEPVQTPQAIYAAQPQSAGTTIEVRAPGEVIVGAPLPQLTPQVVGTGD